MHIDGAPSPWNKVVGYLPPAMSPEAMSALFGQGEKSFEVDRDVVAFSVCDPHERRLIHVKWSALASAASAYGAKMRLEAKATRARLVYAMCSGPTKPSDSVITARVEKEDELIVALTEAERAEALATFCAQVRDSFRSGVEKMAEWERPQEEAARPLEEVNLDADGREVMAANGTPQAKDLDVPT